MNIAGNVVFWILVLLGLTALIVYFERLIDLRRAQIDSQDFLKGVENVLSSGNIEEALAICDETRASVANVVAAAIRHANGSARVLRDAVDAQGRAEIGRLDRRLASLAIIAQVSPLLGLLGAIIGLIRTILVSNAQAVVSRADLMNGAMEALVPAAMGLVVAIPATIMYGALRVRLNRLVVDLEAAATQIVGFISARKEDGRK